MSSKFKIPTLNYQLKLAIEKIGSNKKDVFVNLPTSFANLLSIKCFQALVFYHTTNLPASMSTLEGENFRSVVHLEKRVRPHQRDDFESVISRNPAAFCQQKLVFPTHPNLRG